MGLMTTPNLYERHRIAVRPSMIPGMREIADADRTEPGMLMTAAELADFEAFLIERDAATKVALGEAVALRIRTLGPAALTGDAS